MKYRKLKKSKRKSRKTRRRRINQRGGNIKKMIFCFWTGTNEMSAGRKAAYDEFIAKCGCPVQLVNPGNIKEFLLPDKPLHPGYEYLSETHKSDYLRTYFMHFIGGGYQDIKVPGGDWNRAFDELINDESKFLNGYHEPNQWGVTVADDSVKALWKELPGNGAYIVRPMTEFTTTWYDNLIKVMDSKLEELKKHPATNPSATPETSPGYPVKWSEILGDIFHPLAAKYVGRFLFTVPTPHFTNYK
jgi:hypothetical protein